MLVALVLLLCSEPVFSVSYGKSLKDLENVVSFEWDPVDEFFLKQMDCFDDGEAGLQQGALSCLTLSDLDGLILPFVRMNYEVLKGHYVGLMEEFMVKALAHWGVMSLEQKPLVYTNLLELAQVMQGTIPNQSSVEEAWKQKGNNAKGLRPVNRKYLEGEARKFSDALLNLIGKVKRAKAHLLFKNPKGKELFPIFGRKLEANLRYFEYILQDNNDPSSSMLQDLPNLEVSVRSHEALVVYQRVIRFLSRRPCDGIWCRSKTYIRNFQKSIQVYEREIDDYKSGKRSELPRIYSLQSGIRSFAILSEEHKSFIRLLEQVKQRTESFMPQVLKVIYDTKRKVDKVMKRAGSLKKRAYKHAEAHAKLIQKEKMKKTKK